MKKLNQIIDEIVDIFSIKHSEDKINKFQQYSIFRNYSKFKIFSYFLAVWIAVLLFSDFLMKDTWDHNSDIFHITLLDILMASFLMISNIIVRYKKYKYPSDITPPDKWLFVSFELFFLVWSAIISAIEFNLYGYSSTLTITVFVIATVFYTESRVFISLILLSTIVFYGLSIYFVGNYEVLTNLSYFSLLVLAWGVAKVMQNSKLNDFVNTMKLEEINAELHNEIIFRKQSEEKLKLATEDIKNSLEKEKKLAQLKTSFISMISHDQRTPLTIIKSSLYLLVKKFNIPHDNKHITRIDKAIDHMTNTLMNILTLDRTNTGELQLSLANVDIISLINRIIDEFRVIDKLNHQFIFEKPAEDIEVYSDEHFLMQSISNIISNAVKYSPDNSKINISLKEQQENLKLTISDEGEGISQEEIDKIFDPFYRSDSAKNQTGLGLGMAIVQNCCQSLNIDISINSDISKGTSVTLLIPKKAPENESL